MLFTCYSNPFTYPVTQTQEPCIHIHHGSSCIPHGLAMVNCVGYLVNCVGYLVNCVGYLGTLFHVNIVHVSDVIVYRST